MTRQRGARRRALGLGAAIGIGAWLLSGCGGARTEATSEPDADAREHGEHGGHAEHGEARAVELSPAAVRHARIEVAAAGPARLDVTVEAPGEVHLDAERVLEVRPRYAGVVREIRHRIGDHVAADQVVAVIQSNESLTDYEIASSMAGTVLARHVVTGQAVDHESVLLTIADLSSVWVDFAIYPQVVGRIRPGMTVSIVAQNRPELRATGTIGYVGPLLEQDTRVSSARVVLANPRGEWQPGLFVAARVTLERVRVPVAVPEDAIVRTAEGPAVFRAEGTRFELQPVAVGRSDGHTTEVLSGIAPGDSVVVRNAFVLKSELGKGEVEHEH
jgi:cobalt-zinc-cadmium efflux system membrane fusion protein